MPVSYGFLQFQNGMPLEQTQNVLYAGFLGVIMYKMWSASESRVPGSQIKPTVNIMKCRSHPLNEGKIKTSLNCAD